MPIASKICLWENWKKIQNYEKIDTHKFNKYFIFLSVLGFPSFFKEKKYTSRYICFL